jgi:hypothetical protein
MGPAIGKLHLLALTATAALGILLAAGACGGGDDKTTDVASSTAGGSVGQTSFDISAGDNFFAYAGEKKPTLTVPAGKTITINFKNVGTAIHNMRFAGDDNKYDNGDDSVSNPALVSAGQSANTCVHSARQIGHI